MQLYTAIRPGSCRSFQAASDCVADVQGWFLDNRMLLNPTKTDAVLFGTHARRAKTYTVRVIDVAGTTVQFGDTVKLLGVTLVSR